jgi:hypothetical protein
MRGGSEYESKRGEINKKKKKKILSIPKTKITYTGLYKLGVELSGF